VQRITTSPKNPGRERETQKEKKQIKFSSNLLKKCFFSNLFLETLLPTDEFKRTSWIIILMIQLFYFPFKE
jgi:hypothetical protein